MFFHCSINIVPQNGSLVVNGVITPCKWSYKWVTGVLSPISIVITYHPKIPKPTYHRKGPSCRMKKAFPGWFYTNKTTIQLRHTHVNLQNIRTVITTSCIFQKTVPIQNNITNHKMFLLRGHLKSLKLTLSFTDPSQQKHHQPKN